MISKCKNIKLGFVDSLFIFFSLCSILLLTQVVRAEASQEIKVSKIDQKIVSKTDQKNDSMEEASEPKLKVQPTYQIKTSEGEQAIETNEVVYPKVFSFEGGVEITGKDEKALVVDSGLELKEKAEIRTTATGQVIISLGAKRKVIVLPNSQISIPSISWESGEAPIVILRKGGLYWQAYMGEVSQLEIGSTETEIESHKRVRDDRLYSVALTSGLFQFLAPAADFILFYSAEIPKAEVRVVRGGLQFAAMNAESSIDVQAGELVEFLGVLEGKEIAYDILLKGKRIPRGKLSSKSKFEVAPYLSSLVPEKPKVDLKLIEARKKIAQKKRIEETRIGKYICIKPRGELNQCRWSLESKRCYRYRCDARGEWTDRQWIPSASACARLSKVEACDY